jgi:predicted GIY-YIG superfamily endonuclease
MIRVVRGGVYVLKFSKRTIKIGMASDIEKRLK